LVTRDRDGVVQAMQWTEVAAAPRKDQHSITYTQTVEPDPLEGVLTRRFEAQLASLDAQAERRVQEAREIGRREGEARGRQAALQELEPVFDRLAAAISSTAELRPKLRAQAEGDLVRLAIAIARRIVHRELSIDSDAISGLVRVALEKVRVQEILRIRLHPDHQDAIRAALAKLGTVPVELAPDPILERGGVIVETSRGALDVSIESQFREIERGLTDRLGVKR
jgi:flagellar assembly protein FliH